MGIRYIDNEASTTKPSRIRYIDEPSTQQKQTNPMTLGGFAGNLAKDVQANVSGISNLATAIPRSGYNIGREIAQTLSEDKSVVDPTRGFKQVLSGIFSPWMKEPVKSAQEFVSPVTETASAIAEQGKKTVTHPVKTFYEQPLTTSLLVSPGVPKSVNVGEKAIQSLGLTKASRLAKVEPLTAEATTLYRDMLRPTQAEVKNIEVRGGKDINDFYKIAAEEKLPIKSSGGKEPRLDTTEARYILEEKLDNIHAKINSELSNSKETFNLKEIGDKAKKELRSSIKNDTEYKNAAVDVDEYINDAIQARGEVVSATQLNNIKQGMWKVGYNAMKPTSKSTARKIGYIAKEELQNKLKDAKIKELNDLSGKYATLDTLLENAHSRVIQGGKIGKYVAQTIGAVGGSKLPIVGAPIGAWVGKKVATAMTAPERASAIAASKMDKAVKYSGGKYSKQIDRLLGGNQ